MKLRLQGNSLRLRVSRSELSRLAIESRLEETIFFGAVTGAELTYALAIDAERSRVHVESDGSRVTVLLPADQARQWTSTNAVGITAQVDLGQRGSLSILVEKDFACIDRSAEENLDTFPNPSTPHVC